LSPSVWATEEEEEDAFELVVDDLQPLSSFPKKGEAFERPVIDPLAYKVTIFI